MMSDLKQSFENVAYEKAHQLFGRLAWSELFSGAIRTADSGFVVGTHLEAALKRDKHLIKDSTLKDAFMLKKGKTYKAGDTMRRADLAETFRRLAKDGAASFYNGSVRDDLLADLAELTKSSDPDSVASLLTAEDFRVYQPRVYESLAVPLTGPHTESQTQGGNWTLYSVRPPGSGALLGFILNVMSGYKDIYNEATHKSEDDSALFYHRLIETFKYAYAKRMQFGDELFDRDVKSLVDQIVTTKFAERTRTAIDDSRTYEPSHYGTVSVMRNDHGTAHVSVVDSQGNAAAVSTTINL